MLAEALKKRDYRIVSGGTDNHLILVDVFSKGITGKEAEKALDAAGITVNKNTIPFDTNSPMVTSGIRVGTPALTSRGMREPEMWQIGEWIADVLDNVPNVELRGQIREKVLELTRQFLLYGQ